MALKKVNKKKKDQEEAEARKKKDDQLRARRLKDSNAKKRAAEFSARRIRESLDWKTNDLPNGQLGIECPNPKCKCKAVVNKKKWVMFDTDFRSRGCTYCYTIAFIPKSLLSKKDPRYDDN